MKAILLTLTVIASFVLAGTVGSLEHGNLGITQSLVPAAISVAVIGICVYLLNRLDR